MICVKATRPDHSHRKQLPCLQEEAEDEDLDVTNATTTVSEAKTPIHIGEEKDQEAESHIQCRNERREFLLHSSSMKLFDRERQQQELRNAHNRLAANSFPRSMKGNTNHRELVIITGNSGTGKTFLAQETLASIAAEGFFIHGKCEMMKTVQKPYAPFQAAFAQLVNHALQPENRDLAEEMKRSILEATNGDESMLIDMIPAFAKLFFGSSARSMDEVQASLNTQRGTNSNSAPNHTILAFTSFLRIYCTKQKRENMLVLLLDDLQWLDTYSLQLLKALFSPNLSSLTNKTTTEPGSKLNLAPPSAANMSSGSSVSSQTITTISSNTSVSVPSKMIPNFMVVGTCRGNEVSLQDPLAVALRDLENDRVIITDIKVGNLSQDAVTRLAAEMLGVNPTDCERLASIAFEMTEGHAMYTVQILKTLLERQNEFQAYGDNDGSEGRSTPNFDPSFLLTKGGDNSGNSKINNKHSTMLNIKLASIGGFDVKVVQEVLKIASCLGDTFLTEHVVFLASSSLNPEESQPRHTSRVMVEETLADLCRGGILVPSNDTFPPISLTTMLDASDSSGDLKSPKRSSSIAHSYRWAHDSYLTAAYDLIPEEQKKAYHTNLGRAFLASIAHQAPMDTTVLDTCAFIILHQFASGIDLLTNQGERNVLAQVCLYAGVRAALSSAFEVALTHMALGIDLLDPRSRWDDQYQLSLDLYNGVAEMNYITGQLDRVDDFARQVLKNARTFNDKLRAYESQIFALGARQRFREAVDVGFGVLEEMGDPLPRNPSFLRVGIEFLSAKRLIKDMGTEDIMSLPRLSDTRMTAILRIMMLLFPSFQRALPDSAPLLAARAVRKTIRHGLTPVSASGFMALGFMICFPLGCVDEGIRHCRTAMRIIDEYKAEDLRCRGMLCLHGFALPWKNPLRECMPPLLDAANAGRLTGDLEMMSLSLFVHSCMALFSGSPLRPTIKEMKIRHKALANIQHDTLLTYSASILQLGYNLAVPSTRVDPLVLTGTTMNEKRLIQENEESGHLAGVAVIWTCKCFIALYLGEFKLAYEMALKLRKMNLISFNAALTYQVQFLDGMAEVIAAQQGFAKCRKARAGKRALNELRKYAKNAPANVRNKILLIQAERCVLFRKYERALRKFYASYDCAEEQKNLPEQALAHERTAICLTLQEKGFEALRYLHRARKTYSEWGSPVKINQLTSFAIKHKIGDLQKSFDGRLSSEW